MDLRDSKRSRGAKLRVRVCDANLHQQEKERNFKPEAVAKMQRPKTKGQNNQLQLQQVRTKLGMNAIWTDLVAQMGSVK